MKTEMVRIPGILFLIGFIFACQTEFIPLSESPLSVDSPCRTSYYIIFNETGDAISKVTYEYDEIGRIISIDTDGTVVDYGYDDSGNYNFLMNWNDSTFYGVDYQTDTITQYSIVNSGVNPDSTFVHFRYQFTNLNEFGKPESYILMGGCCAVLEEVSLLYDEYGNVTKELKGLGIARWWERNYNHDHLLKDPFPVPWIYQKQSNALLFSQEIQSIPTFETSYEYQARKDYLEVYIREKRTDSGEIVSEAYYKKYEVYFDCQ